eukprot:1817650-Pleurochrysis_carterae.AAC.1
MQLTVQREAGSLPCERLVDRMSTCKGLEGGGRGSAYKRLMSPHEVITEVSSCWTQLEPDASKKKGPDCQPWINSKSFNTQARKFTISRKRLPREGCWGGLTCVFSSVEDLVVATVAVCPRAGPGRGRSRTALRYAYAVHEARWSGALRCSLRWAV